MYALRIGAAEFTSTGRYFVRVTGTGTNSGKYMFAVETNTSSIDDIASASINEIPNFSCKKATDTFIPVLLVSAADGVTPVTGVAHSSVDADFAVGGATSLTSYSLASADWKEMGEGMYSIRIGAGEFSATGRYFLRVVDTSGNASKYFASIDVNESTIDDVVNNPNNIAVFSAKASTDTFVPVRLTSAQTARPVSLVLHTGLLTWTMAWHQPPPTPVTRLHPTTGRRWARACMLFALEQQSLAQ